MEKIFVLWIGHTDKRTEACSYKKRQKYPPPPKKKKYYLFFMQLFSAVATVFSIFFFAYKKLKNRPQKLLIIAITFYFTVQTSPQPTAQNWFFISKNVGNKHLFSYLWWDTAYSFLVSRSIYTTTCMACSFKRCNSRSQGHWSKLLCKRFTLWPSKYVQLSEY